MEQTTHEIRVTLENGFKYVTRINGTKEEVKAYYVGKFFQFGDTQENPYNDIQKCVSVEFLNE